jgi:hypothetical protein
MKTLILTAFSAALVGGSLSLATKYSPDHALRCDVTTTSSSETHMEATRDGQPVEGRGGGGSMSSEMTMHEVHVDHVVEVKDGHPSKVKRTFETLSGKGEMSFGENSRELTMETPLENVTLEIDQAKDGKCEVTVADGKKPEDSAALEGHCTELFLDALLPDGDVEAKAAWDLDAAAVKRALRIDVARALYAPPAPEEGEGGGGGGGGRGRGGMRGGMMGGDTRLFHEADFKGKAKLVSTDEDVDGTKCAKIEIKIEAAGEMTMPERGAGGQGRKRQDMLESASEMLFDNHYEIRMEGELLVSLKDHRPVSLSLEGTVNSNSTNEREREGVKMKTSSKREGKITYKVKVEEVAATK